MSDAQGYEAIKDRHLGRGNGHAQSEAPTRRFKLIRFNDIKLATTGVWCVRNLIPHEGLVVVWGPPKCGKSFWVFDLVMHVALGRPYRGRRVIQGTVVYVAAEGERGLAARAEAFRRERLQDDERDPPFFLLATRLALANDVSALIDDMRAQVGEARCAVVVIDTLNRTIEGSENDDEAMGNYIRAADAVRETFNCAVVIIHHCGIEATRPRGHTSLAGAADAQIAVKRDAADHVLTTVEWLKDGPEGDQFISALKAVEVGLDDAGDSVSSCVVEAINEPANVAARPSRLSPSAEQARRLLHEAINTDGEVPPSNNHIPAGRHAVKAETWRRYCYEGSITGGATEDARRKAFKRAADKLQAANVIGVWGEWVWLT